MGIENVDGEDPKGCTEATCCEAVRRWIDIRLGFDFWECKNNRGFLLLHVSFLGLWAIVIIHQSS